MDKHLDKSISSFGRGRFEAYHFASYFTPRAEKSASPIFCNERGSRMIPHLKGLLSQIEVLEFKVTFGQHAQLSWFPQAVI